MLELFICHLVADFILQNDKIAAEKAKSTKWASAHALIYLFAMLYAHSQGVITILQAIVISLEHFLQDRFQLHMHWMRFYRQSNADRWPTGPLIIDQCFHIVFMYAVYKLMNF